MKSVRIFYKKTGRMKFISHLDMNRFMSRLIARAKIPVWYTEGFNQHIYMNFALPLSLGFEGLYEILEIRLADEGYPLLKCLEALCSVAPPDIEFFDVKEPVMPMKDIAFAEYKLSFEELSPATKVALKEFLSRESILCQKSGKKGKVKEIDLIPKIKAYQLSDNELTLMLSAGNEDNLNPSLVMSAFFEQCGIAPIFYSVKRTSVLAKNGDKFI